MTKPLLLLDVDRRRYGCVKLPAIGDFVDTRPAGWVDDATTLAVLRWARRQRQPLLFLPTHVHVGLTERHTARREGWAGSLGEKSRVGRLE